MSVESAVSEGSLAGSRSFARRNVKLFVGLAVIIVAAAYLILNAARGSTAYYLTVDELSKQGPTGRNVRVAGTIVGGSIDWDARDLRLTFDITDPGGVLNVVYHGPRPDMFRDGAEVVVEGQYAASGKLEARQLLLKCPSKYEEKQ